ncbi:putative N-glycosylase/DNA lyase [Methanobacterium sp. MB1]|jgi:N-glycosylase/DNA lyase|uniref:DNA glycosylase n=2 Tax=Methanobacterium sp. TaxID=2164 RepID=UPI0003C96173|nr:DNA glycosylase [uncultured Methanobacterium sp.]CDG66088.1 putative N-glycosylase/DNA lyase [Methanobacterium sp. MB1]
MKTQFNLRPKGPINLALTINSGQTSQPPWKESNQYFQELVMVNDAPCLVKIGHEDSDPDSSVNIKVESPEKIPRKAIESKIRDIFGLDHDLDQLYDFLGEDPKLKPTIAFCQGLRIFKAHNLFECIISSISSANCSILRWTRSVNDIKRRWGDGYRFSSGDFYTFPSPTILSRAPEHDLEEMQRWEDNLPPDFVFDKNLKACGVGYRAKYIINASRMVQSEINLEKLARMKYEKAFDTILQLPGVGPKVADCILLYGLGMGEAFPVDVWIKRIIEHLYFPGKELKPEEVREFGMERYGNWAGYVQLYLFHYARKSGLLESLKKK